MGSWFKRLYAFDNLFGSTARHLQRYGRAIREPDIAGQGLLREPARAA